MSADDLLVSLQADTIEKQRKCIRELSSALARTLNNFTANLSGKPVRDASETIAEAEAMLLRAKELL